MKVLKAIVLIALPILVLVGCDKTGGTPPGTEWSPGQAVGLIMLTVICAVFLIIMIVKNWGFFDGTGCGGGCCFDCGGDSCGSSCGSCSSCGGCGD